MISLLLSSALAADTYEDTFLSDAGRWSGGVIADGALSVQDSSATLELGEIRSLSATLLLTKRDAGDLRLALGDRTWTASYEPDGGLSLGGASLPFPELHRTWVPDADPVLTEGPEFWDGGNVLHCDVHYDEASATWFLYYTGEMASGYPYRQIGLATSTDGETWTEYAGNPVLSIDYDKTTVDGIHVHMPSVVVDPSDSTWHMYYSCYQDGLGNRICHATSPDGYTWTPYGVVLDFGAEGEVDSGSLRMPDVSIGEDGTWHMLYNATVPDQHYGPTVYASSPDGWTWTKEATITADETDLQGGGVVQTAYGLEQLWNCDDVFCYSRADASDWTSWTQEDDVVLAKGWADWSSGYVQAPSLWLVGETYHMWFNAYEYATDAESLGHAATEPSPGQAFTLTLDWDGATLRASFDGWPTLEAATAGVTSLTLSASGAAALDEIRVVTEPATTPDSGGDDSGGGDSGGVDTPGPTDTDTGGDSDSAATASEDEGCGCGGSKGAFFLAPLAAFALAQRRKSEGRRSAR